MRSFAAALVFVLAASTASAAPLVSSCTDSWDGPEMTTCEILGRESDAVGIVFNAHNYRSPVWLFGFTSYDVSNTLTILADGTLQYQRDDEHASFTSISHFGQFAYWVYPTYTIVGIEDLGWVLNELSDYDYNDHVVRFDMFDVPEPATVLLVGAGLVLVLARRRRAVA